MASYEGSLEDFWQAVQALLTKPGVPVSDVHGEQIQSFLNFAYRWLLESLAAEHATEALFQSTQTIQAHETTQPFSGLQTSAFFTPQQMWERAAGSSEQWQPMTFFHPLPANAVQTRRLRFWDVGNVGNSSGFRFVGATINVEIKFSYIGRVTDHISDPREAVAILGCTNILAAYVAHLFCVASTEPARRSQAAIFLNMAREHLDNYLIRDVKLWQMRPVRSRRPRFGLTHRKGY